MHTTPTTAWSQNRWQDWVYIIHVRLLLAHNPLFSTKSLICGIASHSLNSQWLMDMAPQGQEQLLWDAAELTQQQSWDWDAYYDQSGVGSSGAYVGKTVPKFPTENVGGWTMYVSVLGASSANHAPTANQHACRAGGSGQV
jgi:hypothetical protein